MSPQLDKKIDTLAEVVKAGFISVDEKIDSLAAATSKGFEEVGERFKEVDRRFDEVDKRLDRIEFLVNGHDQRLDILEDRVRQVAVKVGLRFN